ncbi:MAG: peptide deformylase [Clostridia bacterium]
MAIRNIVKFGDAILNKKCRTVEKFDARLHTLLDDMIETLKEANGAGLAGPQVGMLKRVCIVDVDEVIELINPEIIEQDGLQDGAEGCLSNPGEYGMVERPNYVKVRAQDRNGNFFEVDGTELKARAFCHEIDHLNGMLFIDKVSRMLTPEELEADDEEE